MRRTVLVALLTVGESGVASSWQFQMLNSRSSLCADSCVWPPLPWCQTWNLPS